MRQIANELGISKSALYHYFPSKELLFSACTEFVVDRDGALISTDLQTASPSEKAANLMAVFKEVEKGFQGEAFLLMDYLKGKSPSDIARDKNMKLANKRYLEMTAAIVGPEFAAQVLTTMLGAWIQRLFDGRKTSLKEIERWLQAILENASTTGRPDR
eukprot:s1_g1571.t1